MSVRRIAIGDIHGCNAALERLLQEIDPQSEDKLILLGDYVDRGPNSKGVIECLMSLQERCRLIPLQGNHELMMRMAVANDTDRNFWLNSGGQATLASYGNQIDLIPASHLDFLENCVPYHEEDDFFFVHANYTPKLPLARQPDFALFWEHLSAHTPAPHISGKTAVVGHTPQRSGNVLDLDHLICIDTFCYGGGYLTALDIDSRKSWQANLHGELRASTSEESQQPAD